MAEEEVVTFPVLPSDHKRKLENVESEVLEQHPGSTDRSNEVPLDDGDKSSDYSQAKRPKLDDEPAAGLGVGKILGIGSTTENGEDFSGLKNSDESKEEGISEPVVLEVQEPIHADESDKKMENGKPEDNQPTLLEVVTTQEGSVEESKGVDASDSQKEADDNSKETNDAISQKEIGNESKEVNGCSSQQEDDKESFEANAGDTQKEAGEESKEVNGRGSHGETGYQVKEVNGDSPLKEVDDAQFMTRRIDVPSSKVGKLIGKGGEMVRYLQLTSGARIQIRRDAEADPNAPLRPVEIIGNVASVEKAEKLINQVIEETETGVPALFARGVPEQMEIKVPSDKVGVIIGRGGETIKNMQTKSRARIQLIPQGPEGDGSKERTVRISGDKRQIDIATALIKDVMYQEGRPSHYSGGGFNQPAYQPRGPGGPPQWSSRGPHGPHSMPYDYHHGATYPSQGSHHRPPNSGGYPPQHMPHRRGYSPGWEQRPPHSGPYEYYGRPGAQTPGPVPSHVAPPYSQAGAQHNYGQTYDPRNYDNPRMQQSYPPYGYGGSQQGYPPAGGQHQMQQPPRPYGLQGSAEPGYGPPRPAPPRADVPYQGPTPTGPSYGTNMAPQQQYGYASSGPAQHSYPSYSSTVPSDGYNGTQAPAIMPAYEQQHSNQPASGMQAGYRQVPTTSGYSSYPSTQPAYVNTPAQSNVNYDSQYPVCGGGNASAYAAAPVGQTTYSQTAPAHAGYDQSATQSAGYVAAPGTA